MAICEFCLQRQDDNQCRLGLRIPSRMSCREFAPGIEKFCANPNDFVDPTQIIQMASYFGVKGTELKKIKLMASQAANLRLAIPLSK